MFAQLPDISQAQSPGVAYALIAGSILIAFAPVALAILKDRGSPAKEPDTPLPTAVDRGTDLAERYFTSLEARAERAEELLEQTRADLAETQRNLDRAHTEIEQLRQQIQRLTWRIGGDR